MPRRGSSSRATCSTGGIRRAGAAPARAVRTISSGSLTWWPATSRRPATNPCSTRRCRSSRRPLLEPDQHENYMLPRVSSETASLFEHCVRAIKHSMKYGAHGLPLIGSGDWNDGMNRVGHRGRGESVWLGWFLVTVLDDFAPLCERRGRGRSGAAAIATKRAGSPACWSSRGTATGIAAPTSTTARRWGRCRTRSAGSIR